MRQAGKSVERTGRIALSTLRDRIRQRLVDEVGRIPKAAPFTVALCYPSPYRAGMSSLGYQRIYRALMEAPGLACERAFLDDECESDAARVPERPVTYESLRPIDDLPVLAFSVAYELEIAGVIRMLEAAGVPPRRRDRDARHPVVIAGGPLTFSNPLPLAGLVDAIVVGEADARAVEAVRAVEAGGTRLEQLDRLAADPPRLRAHPPPRPAVGRRGGRRDPAGPLGHPDAPRRPREHVPRRDRARLLPRVQLLRHAPLDERRDAHRAGRARARRHPRGRPAGRAGGRRGERPPRRSCEIVNALADRGCEVGLSSLRPDRLANTQGFVAALARVGYRTLTTAMDGTSERVRETLERRARPKHLRECAELAKAHGMDRMKLYLMVGTPGETDEDVDECVAFATELSRIVPLALGIAPFCAKRNTPLDGAPFAGIKVVDGRLARLRKGLRGRVDVRATSARWAWVEYVLAQGGEAEGLAVLDAVAAGGSFRDYERAFATSAKAPRRKLSIVVDSP